MAILIMTTMMIIIIKIIDNDDHEEDDDIGESMNISEDFRKTLGQFKMAK